VDELGEERVKTRPRCATLGLDTLKATLEEYRRQQIRGEQR
jgi:NifU-like protein involved in Fe-S cluster formation